MGQCAFGKAIANGVWESRFPFGTDQEVRFLYLRDGDRQWLLAATDFSYMFRRTSLALRQAIAQETGVPVDWVWTHDSQSHSAPIALDLDGKACDRLIEVCVPAARETVARAEEAQIRSVVLHLGDRFNIHREQYIPGLGAVTVWTGCQFDSAGRAYSQDPSVMLLEEWKPNLPAFEKPIYFDRPADPHAALLVFRNPAGKVLGSVARFSAHPDVVGACAAADGSLKDYRYHHDWPGCVRDAVEARLGGPGICVVGPCGNLSTKKLPLRGYDAGVRQAEEIGQAIASACLNAWEPSPAPWQPLRLGPVALASIDLPLREGFPRSRAELAEAPAKAEAWRNAYRKAIQEGQPASRVRELIDLYHHWAWVPRIVDRWAGLSDEELAQGIIRVHVGALRVNDLVLAALPGESLTETCQWLRAQSLGERLVVMDMLNGYACYQTTAEQYDLGGYSATCSCLAREAERVTRREALRVIRNVAGG